MEKKILEITTTNVRDFADPPHFKVDDEPYGGGPGMVLKPEPLFRAVSAAKTRLPEAKVILLSPSGKPFSQSMAVKHSKHTQAIFVCGRYEGVDARLLDLVIDEEWSIGDYVLMGGEVPAMVVIEAIVRLQANVIGNKSSLEYESFSEENSHLLEAPQYTRPAEFNGLSVPSILLSGDHNSIAQWRHEAAKEKTRRHRPDLLTNDKSFCSDK